MGGGGRLAGLGWNWIRFVDISSGFQEGVRIRSAEIEDSGAGEGVRYRRPVGGDIGACRRRGVNFRIGFLEWFLWRNGY